MQQPPDFLLFDLDGTLVDSVPDLALAVNLLRAELGLSVLPLPVVATMVGDGAAMLVRRALGDDRFSESQLQRFLHLYRAHLLDSTRCFPGITELLHRHDPQRMAVITNKPHDLSCALLEGLGIRDRFAVLVGGDSLQCKKPSPLPVHFALKQLGAAAQQSVMIGDHHNDLRAGRGAGTATCFCSYGLGDDQGLPCDFRAADPSDLLSLFPGHPRD